MSRVREHMRHTALFLALATCLSSGCIFSPTEEIIPPSPPPVIDSEEALIAALSRAYLTREDQLFKSLLANDPDRNAEYLFLLSEQTTQGETQWGFEEEARIHQRMFHPESPLPGDTMVETQYWLEGLNITLSIQEPFTERTDLYSGNGGLDGKLDPAIWRVTDARYTTYVFFDMIGTDYKVEGEANFVVLEDLGKDVGDAGKFLIFIWEDLLTPAKPASAGPAA